MIGAGRIRSPRSRPSSSGGRGSVGPSVVFVLGLGLAGCETSGHGGGIVSEPDAGVDAGEDAGPPDSAIEDSGISDGGREPPRCTSPLGFDRYQFGSPEDDVAVAVGLDSDCGIHVAGTTRGKLQDGTGSGAAGGRDLFLRRLGRGASDSFTVQLGSPADESVTALAVTAEGDSVVVGSTEGALPGGGGPIGLDDVLVARFASTGERRWLTQYGTLGSDFALDVGFLPGGDVLVAGTTNEDPRTGFDITLDQLGATDGQRLVGQRRGTEQADRAEALTIGADGRVYVAGATQGSLAAPHRGSFDAFVSGSEWLGASAGFSLQVGTTDIDAALDVAVDADGCVYVALVSFADLVFGAEENDGIQSPFVAKLDRHGRLLWLRRIAPAALPARGVALAIDPEGGVFVAGSIVGSDGEPSAGGRDAIVWRIDDAGDVRSSARLGTAGEDEARDLLVTGAGELVVVGSTGGEMVAGQRSGGGLDAFVIRLVLP